MKIKDILQILKDNTIDVSSALDLILVYIDDKEERKVATILKLVNDDKIDVISAENMICNLTNNKAKVSKTVEKKLHNKKSNKDKRAARPLEQDEYIKIINLCKTGFTYLDEDGMNRNFRPNKQLAMTFILQANLGLRISDILKLKPITFKHDKLEIIEKKTGKLQYRTINQNVKELIYKYAEENDIKDDEYLINVTVRAIQKQLAIITKYLKLNNISSHSFRKMFGVTVYNQTNGNIELLKELFNHSSIATTQRYIKVSQKKIDEVSASIDFTGVLDK